MHRSTITFGIVSAFCLLSFTTIDYWGFFGHRLINRTAVYTLPTELYGFYKKHIQYIEYHSIDPDKRRYAVKAEGVRHYIDLDHWEHYKLLQGRPLSEIIFEHADIMFDVGDGRLKKIKVQSVDSMTDAQELAIYAEYRNNWSEILSEGTMEFFLSDNLDHELKVKIMDNFSGHGILPYHLSYYYRQLEQAFVDQDVEDILKYSSEIGHYISDAHVPLHTTENYDGQLTGQNGIHAFWESRIPELFAFQEYDLFVDKAQYIEDMDQYIWDIILDTHDLVYDVLAIEKELSLSWPEDQQYCYDQRGASVMRLQCEAYAKAYQDRMEDMVETQMRKSISALGSIWYTAWENGGRPDLNVFQHKVEIEKSDIEAETHILRNN